MDKKKFSVRSRLKSFTYAFNGFKILLANEHNSWIHGVATVLAILGGFFFRISTIEWIAIILCICLVFAFELINSSVEYLANFVSPEYQPLIKKVKDLAAAAVLSVAIGSLTIGLIIFIPKIICRL